jgi:hypothetical protein
MASKRFYRRRFLNRRGHHAGAYVIAECKFSAPTAPDKRGWISATVRISDCFRVAELDFGGGDRAAIGNALYKARLLRDTMIDLTEALEQAVEEWERPAR